MEFEQRRPKRIYIIRMYGSDYYKIGVASNVEQRIRSLQQGNPVLLMRVWQSVFCDAESAYIVEHYIHDRFRSYRMSAPHQREWFRLTPAQVKQIQEMIEGDLQSDRLLTTEDVELVPNNA